MKWSDGEHGDQVNIESYSDYIVKNDCRNSEFMIVHSHKERDFSNVMIVTSSNTIIHNIYASKTMLLFRYIYQSHQQCVRKFYIL